MLMEKLRNTSDDSRCVNAKIERGLLLLPKSETQIKPRNCQEKCEVSGKLGMQFFKKKLAQLEE